MTDEEQGGGASKTTDPAWGSSTATDVSQKEFFSAQLGWVRQVNRERFAFVAVAGGIIWFFIERHLAELNHENARVAKIAETTVSEDTYDANERRRDDERAKLDEWRKEVDRDRTQTVSRDEVKESAATNRQTNTGLWIAATAIIVSIVVAAMTIMVTRGPS